MRVPNASLQVSQLLSRAVTPMPDLQLPHSTPGGRKWVGRQEVGGEVGSGWGGRKWVGRQEVGGEVGSGWGGRKWVGRQEVAGR